LGLICLFFVHRYLRWFFSRSNVLKKKKKKKKKKTRIVMMMMMTTTTRVLAMAERLGFSVFLFCSFHSCYHRRGGGRIF
jgi:hypothetical protein